MMLKEYFQNKILAGMRLTRNRIVGHDYDTNIYLELFKERGSDKVTLILQKRN